jgi:hypothetical protein
MASSEVVLNVEGVVREFEKSIGQNKARLDQLKVEHAIVEAQIREQEGRRDELSTLIAQLTGVVQAETEWQKIFATAQQSQAPAGASDGK